MSDAPLPLPASQPSAQPAATDPGSGQAAANQSALATPLTIKYEDFAKIDLRVGTVIEAKPAPKGDRLLVLQVDLGTEKRQILAGIRQHVTPEAMVGRQIVIVANLEPRTLKGLTSEGMLLAASDASGKVVVVSPSEQVGPGSKVS